MPVARLYIYVKPHDISELRSLDPVVSHDTVDAD
jgi:hypothetical protein